MIYIYSNNPSGLWGLFSANILGLPAVFIGHKNIINNNRELTKESMENLWYQGQFFGNNIFETMENITYDNKKIINDHTMKDYFILIENNDFVDYNKDKVEIPDPNIHYSWIIKGSNFYEEISQLSEIIGCIYNQIPNKPPLTSIPHTTSTIKI
jgi:hypothetical protein